MSINVSPFMLDVSLWGRRAAGINAGQMSMHANCQWDALYGRGMASFKLPRKWHHFVSCCINLHFPSIRVRAEGHDTIAFFASAWNGS